MNALNSFIFVCGNGKLFWWPSLLYSKKNSFSEFEVIFMLHQLAIE
jgi:hypothetical protein